MKKWYPKTESGYKVKAKKTLAKHKFGFLTFITDALTAKVAK